MRLIALIAVTAIVAKSVDREGEYVLPKPDVQTSFGTVRGYLTKSVEGTMVKVFKGIPQAAPPLGKLRYRMPQDPESWNGTRDATKYMKGCRVTPTTYYASLRLGFSEDCLYTNIFADARCTPEKKCPVIFYIHGGNLVVDAANMFNDTFIIEHFAAHGIVMVIPEFRQTYAGSAVFDDPKVVPRNLALHDLHHALRWVNRDIGNFGGDVTKITMMGHSMGGSYALFLAFSPHFTNAKEKLFDKLIPLSPVPRFPDIAKQKNLTRIFVDTANCTYATTEETLECMQEIGDDELYEIYEGFRRKTKKSLNGIVLDDPIFPDSDIRNILKNPMKSRMMIGSTAAEMDFDTDMVEVCEINHVGDVIGLQNLEELDQIYLKLRNSRKIVTRHCSKSQGVYLGVYAYSALMVEAGADVYLYSYDQWEHSKHTDDLALVMGIHNYDEDANERIVARFYPELFRNYTLYDIPSPNWTPLNLKDDNYYSIKVALKQRRFPEMKNHYEKATLDFWYRLAPKIDRYITELKSKNKTLDFLRDLVLPGSEIQAPEEDASTAYVVVLSLGMPILLFVALVLGCFLYGCFCQRHCEKLRYWQFIEPTRGSVVNLSSQGNEQSPLLPKDD